MEFGILVDESHPTDKGEISRPINTFIPPSVDHITSTWDMSPFPAIAPPESIGDPTAYEKEGFYAIIHKSKKDEDYHVSLVIAEGEGVVFTCDCLSDQEAAGISLMVSIILERDLPILEEEG